MQQRTRRHPHGFTLIEMMVASAIAFILVAAAATMASAMARNVKRAEEQIDLGTRASILQSFVVSRLGGAAYNWNVPKWTAASVNTGSFGSGACASSTGMCAANGKIFPLEFCTSTSVGASTCGATTVSTADALKTYVPRDALIEAVQIMDRNGTALTSACTAANVPTTVTFDVKGITTSAWASGDLILISKFNHVTLATVAAAFTTGSDPSVTRQLQVNLGDGTNLANDDGDGTAACDAKVSLKSARIMRITQAVLKIDDATKTLQYGSRSNSSATLAAADFVPIISDVDDLQLRLDIAHIPSTGSPSFCTSDVAVAVLDNGDLSGGACNGQKLASAGTNINRVVGLSLGIVLRASAQTQSATNSIPYMFDRTGPSAPDKRLRRTFIVYLGLPNASGF